ncbi:MAG: type II secretion system F family protein [Opitutaceae bacterium]|nr:type II secretion system F family protein [Opitutaceae bacterium]
MPHFSYTARNRAGQTLPAVIEAPSRKEAARLLTARGLQLLSLTETTADVRPLKDGPPGPPPAPGDALARPTPRATTAPGLSRKLRLPFLQTLSDLTSSGLSAGEAVRLLSIRLKEPELRALCTGLWERLGEGLPLSRAMEAYPGVFDSQTTNLISAGEATGNLNEVLQRLIQHFAEQKEMRQKILAALAYPAFICAMAVVVILFFIFFLLPQLQKLLSALGGKLPVATKLLVGLSDFLMHYGLLVAIAVAFGAVSFWRWRRTEAGRETTDRWLLRLPFTGAFITGSTILNFSQTLAVLLENGVTTAEALRMTERTLTNRTLQRAFTAATARVLEGESLSSSLNQTGCFPDLVLDRLTVGENTGNLVPSLRDIGRTYQKELSRQLQIITNVVSSAVLMFAFGFVAFIAYAIVSAVFSLSASFKF